VGEKGRFGEGMAKGRRREGEMQEMILHMVFDSLRREEGMARVFSKGVIKTVDAG
jgi:hypothetical protein